MGLNEDDRRGRYARQHGGTLAAWEPTGPQRRRITHKNRHASPTGEGLRRRAEQQVRAELAVSRRAERDGLLRSLIGTARRITPRR